RRTRSVRWGVGGARDRRRVTAATAGNPLGGADPGCRGLGALLLHEHASGCSSHVELPSRHARRDAWGQGRGLRIVARGRLGPGEDVIDRHTTLIVWAILGAAVVGCQLVA